jgi:hypothetical protein
MKKTIRKILIALRPYTLDTYVYKYDLAQPIPDVKARIELDVKSSKKKTLLGEQIVFSAFNNGKLANKTALIFNNLLGIQLGYKGYPLLGNGETYPEFRGNNIHGHMLVYILNYYLSRDEKKTVYMFIAPDNIPVQKVMDKVGCERLYRVKVKRILGLCMHKKIVNDK